MDDIKITELQRISIKPNDVLVYKTDSCLSMEARQRIKDNLERYLRQAGINNTVFVIDSGAVLYPIGMDELKNIISGS